jgi:hypothetical protein
VGKERNYLFNNKRLRAKNAIFNEMVLNNKAPEKTGQPDKPQGKPHLKLVK